MTQDVARTEPCPLETCGWSGSFARLLEHIRLKHSSDKLPADFVTCHRLSRCPGCSHWYLNLSQHLSKTKCRSSSQFKSVSNQALSSTVIASTSSPKEMVVSESMDCERESGIIDPPLTPGSSHPVAKKIASYLPEYKRLSPPSFSWGNRDGTQVSEDLSRIYQEVVFWKKNLFLLPSGKVGKEFIAEMTRLIDAHASATALEGIALKALVVLQVLLLQKPHAKSKARDHVSHLQRRLLLWKNGKFDDLLQECRSLQQRLQHSFSRKGDDDVSRIFNRLMIQGKVNAALRYLSDNSNGGVLSLDSTVEGSNGKTARELLHIKHPQRQPLLDSVLLEGPEENVPSIIFDRIDGSAIRAAALRTQGAGGPSGVDSVAWRRFCCSFHTQSIDLCNALAALSRRLCTEFIDPQGVQALVACRLIPLDKCPGLRPIGIGETFRRILAKAIMVVVRDDIQLAAGSFQVCAGQNSGSEAAIHAMQEIFQAEDSDCVLLVDANNAFNSLNRQAALHNSRILCPVLATALINTYRSGVQMYVVGGDVIQSVEGTTQGDPLAMSMYAIAVLPLITRTAGLCKQVWFADDATGAGSLADVRKWWEALSKAGPDFGYHPNAKKTWLIVKKPMLEQAQAIFKETGILVTANGKRHLGAALGDASFVEEYVNNKVNEWVKQVRRLAEIAQTQPHAAYCAFQHGLTGRWTYLLRTVKGISSLLAPLENVIRTEFIPALSGQSPFNDEMRKLLALPCRLGGLNIINPTEMADWHYNASTRITASLAALIVAQDSYCPVDKVHVKKTKALVKSEKQAKQQATLKELLDDATPALNRRIELASEKGASSWLTVLPISQHSFHLAKSDFRDALCLRYGWHLQDTSSKCACGSAFTVDHAMICSKGGFPSMRHNEVRDITADLLTEICSDVAIEPQLTPLSGESFQKRTANAADEARVDVSARGFWCRGERAFFYIRVFYPDARSNRQPSLLQAYRNHECEKKRSYGERIREIERGSFTPLVLSSTGGMGQEVTLFYKRIANLIADKQDATYSHIIQMIRCRLSFSLLRSAILCIRGTRSSQHHPLRLDVVNIVRSEARLTGPE